MSPYLPLARKYSKYDAEDLSQELALLAWQMTLRGYKPWQIGNRLKDRAKGWYRSERRRCRLFQGFPAGFDMAKPEVSPLIRGLLLAVLEALPDQDKALCKSISEGKTFREISVEAGISPASVCRRVREIRKRI